MMVTSNQEVLIEEHMYETVLPSLMLDFSAYTLIFGLLLTKKLGRRKGTRLMHCSEVQKTDTKFVVGNSKYICCGWWDGECRQKVAKG